MKMTVDREARAGRTARPRVRLHRVQRMRLPWAAPAGREEDVEIGLIFVALLRAEHPPVSVVLDECRVDERKPRHQITVMPPRAAVVVGHECGDRLRARRFRHAEQPTVLTQEEWI